MLSKPKVLVVEDDTLVAAMLALVLETAGYGVAGPAVSEDEALRLAETEAIGAAVLDFQVLGGDTRHVAWHLRAAGVPFLFFSAVDPRTIREAVGGPIPIIPKGEIRPLVEALDTILSSRRAALTC